jgi:tetratricopeptide (TPR) repeat protein
VERANREQNTDTEAAILDYKKAVKINPSCFECYEKMANLYCWGNGKKNYTLARSYYYKSLKNLKCIEENLDKQGSLIEKIAMTYFLELGDNDKGLKKYTKIKIHLLDSLIRINPHNDYYIKRADLKRDYVLKDFKGALADYKFVLNNKGHDNYHVLWNIGYCNLSLLNYTEALKYYKKTIDVLENEEKNSYTLEQLSKLYSSKGDCKMNLQDYRGAIEDYQTSLSKLQLSEKTGNFDFLKLYTNIGKAKLLLSDFNGGIIELKKAIQFDNKTLSVVDGEIFENVDLAYAYYLLGYGHIKLLEIEQACSAWSKSGDLGNKEAYTAIKEYCTN